MADHLDELFQTLQHEFKALSDNELEAMQQAAANKSRLTELLEDLENERLTVLRKAGFDLDKTGVLAYLSTTSRTTSDALKALWTQIENLSRVCERQNKINGVIIENNKRRTETSLLILQGQATETQLYSATGNAVTTKRIQSLAKV